MSTSLEEFLDDVASGDLLDLARVNIAGGGDLPFYCGQMRSFWREEEADTNEAVSETFGIRSLLVDAQTSPIKVPKIGGVSGYALHAPALMRLHPRAREFGNEPDGTRSRRFYLWDPAGKIVEGTLAPSDAASDVLVSPISRWPSTDAKNIRFPHLRLVEGRVAVELELDGKLASLLGYDAKQGTLFGGLSVDVVKKRLRVVLVPGGVEIEGALPDPTRDFEGGEPGDRITGTFRLECGTTDDKPQYLLRLVDTTDQEAINGTENRIALALSGLTTSNAPVAIRYDKRPVVPPLYWMLTHAGSKLRLEAGSLAGDFKMRIAEGAVDVRIRTRGKNDGERGLATLFAREVTWNRGAVGSVRLEIGGGRPVTGAVATELSFANKDGEWSSSIDDIVDRPFSIPLGSVAERLLPIYRDGGGIGADMPSAPYVFIPVHEGWLQLALPAPGPDDDQSVSAGVSDTTGSAMSGRIFVSHQTTDHGVVIDDAAAILLSIDWSERVSAISTVTLEIQQARGQLLGFIYAVESSPTSREGLPTLQGGPAATRDLPLWFGMDAPRPNIGGSVTWTQSDGTFRAVLDVQTVIAADGAEVLPAALAWLPPGDSPFITNIALARTLPSSPDPSVSRGLVPTQIAPKSTITLMSQAGLGLPVAVLSASEWFDPSMQGMSYSLLLPTLAGTEFRSSGANASIGLDQARLRFDLPILDELFAWSDPPKKAPSGSGIDSGPVARRPTALEPLALAASWMQSLDRIDLTRTQAAEVSGWISTGEVEPVVVGGLVAPFEWHTDLRISPELPDAWGSYLLDEDRYRLDRAAEGLGGVDGPVGFSLRGAKLVMCGHDIVVVGNAANLFPFQMDGGGPDILWDSRGFGLGQYPFDGARAMETLLLQEGSLAVRQMSLRTLNDVLRIKAEKGKNHWSFDHDLLFFVRDLATDGMVFTGDKNPIENAMGMNGQAFDATSLPVSLHEWRLFEDAGGVGKHDIKWGPFSFKPLRLLRVEFDEENEPVKIAVVGGLRFDPAPLASGGRTAPDGPYEADDVYVRPDLFELVLTRKSDRWTQIWSGVKAAVHKPNKEDQRDRNGERLDFGARKPEISIDVELTHDGLVTHARDRIPATITLDIGSLEASLSARLFGFPHRLSGAAEAREYGFSVSFDIAEDAKPGRTGVMFCPTKACAMLDDSARLLRIDGSVEFYATLFGDDDEIKSERVASVGANGIEWLGITGAAGKIEVDHNTGALTWEARVERQEPTLLPFRLKAARLALKAAFTCIVADFDERERSVLGALPMGSAWLHVAAMDPTQPHHRITHELLASRDGQRSHSLEITWSKQVDSPILWPEGQVFDRDGAALPADWIAPGKANQKFRSREISISGDDDKRLTHHATLQFRQHRIDADQLAVADGEATVVTPVRLLVITEHQLLRSQQTCARWTTVDHVVITSRALMAEECDEATIVPFEAGNTYRGSPTGMKHNGIAAFHLALAGFHDRLLTDAWWRQGAERQAIILGGAVVQFPLPQQPALAFTTVFPWLDLPDEDGSETVLRLNSAAGRWQVPAADLWSAAPMDTGALPPVVIGSRQAGSSVGKELDGASFTASHLQQTGEPNELIPVEQVFFEKLGANAALGPSDVTGAPFFLRTMMAITARIALSEAGSTDHRWSATTIERRGSGHVVRASVKDEPVTVLAGSADELVPASLIVLSRHRASVLVGYRRVAAAALEDLVERRSRDEIAELATTLDTAAIIAIRIAAPQGQLPGIALREIPPVFGGTAKGRMLTDPDDDVGPSAALGWPSAATTKDLARYSSVLGSELPVLGHQAGFAARFEVFGWPAYAPGRHEGTSPQALYVSFGNHVVYDRGSAASLTFDGPSARHLIPAIARRRAPLDDQTDKVLRTIVHSGTGGQSAGPLDVAPILPPSIERGTLGRRPGVFEVVTTSMTLPADSLPFDSQHERFGRPANSGPLIAHQLRNPRSPVLPKDELAQDRSLRSDPEHLAELQQLVFSLRRRTYLSMVDCEIETGKFALFGSWLGSADVLRLVSDQEDRHDRVVFRLGKGNAVGPAWDGLVDITLDAAKVPLNAANPPQLRIKGWMEVGAETFPFSFVANQSADFIELVLDGSVTSVSLSINDTERARKALGRATVDTPLRVLLDIVPTEVVDVPQSLPQGPRFQVVLPLLLDAGDRRVIPVQTRSFAFGDPSYDRQLGSQPAADRELMMVGAKEREFLLALDRKEYDLGLSVYLAGGVVVTDSGEFDVAAGVASLSYSLEIFRLPPQLPNGDQPPPERLALEGIKPDADGNYTAYHGRQYQIPLRKLTYPTAKGPVAVCPLQPGDRLQLSAKLAGPTSTKNLPEVVVTVDLVAEPVIAPPPSVYTVIESTSDLKVARAILHASAPLPQKIEFPDLLGDLAKGHVRRRALFVWRHASAGLVDEKNRLDLIKFDRSGGSQLPQ